MNTKVHHKVKVANGDPLVLIDFLTHATKMSKSRLKVVLTRGGVWSIRRKKLRVRRATSEVRAGDIFEVYDDTKLELPDVSGVYALEDGDQYSVWFKPAGVFSQGTPYGDEGSMLRLLEKSKREVFLIHRLDRETAGIMLFAHTSKAAAMLSKQFADNEITKIYQAEVKGKIEQSIGVIDRDLGGKHALTHYQVIKRTENSTFVQIELETGRLHQARRHFEAIGHPILGDPKYGKKNKDLRGLQLVASELTVPWIFKEPKHYTLNEDLRLF